MHLHSPKLVAIQQKIGLLYARKINRTLFSLDSNVPSELLSATVLGREFQEAGAERRNAKSVLTNGAYVNNATKITPTLSTCLLQALFVQPYLCPSVRPS